MCCSLRQFKMFSPQKYFAYDARAKVYGSSEDVPTGAFLFVLLAVVVVLGAYDMHDMHRIYHAYSYGVCVLEPGSWP